MRRATFLALMAAMALPAFGCESISGRGHGRQYGPPSPVSVRPFKFGRPDVVLLITGGTNGQMELCNCAGPMPGSLSRRGGLIRSYRAAFDHTFVLDTGDVFWILPGDVLNEFILKACREVGYDAVALGDQEWAEPRDRLRAILEPGPMKYLSSTVAPADEAAGLPLASAVKCELGNIRLAILSDVRKEALMFFPDDKLRTLRFAATADLARQAAELKGQGFVVIAVSHGDQKSAETTAETIPADLVIRGHTRQTELKLLIAAGKPMVKVGGWEYVGVVGLKVADGRITDIEYRAELVEDRWPADTRVLQIYQAYARAYMRKVLDGPRKKGLDYALATECAKCHADQYKNWHGTRHAGAYGTIERAKRTGDPNCLMCHTTGFNTEKGFITIQKTPQMAGVQCQECHRFNMAEHRQKGFVPPKINDDLCTTCHTPITDPNFNFKSRLAKVRCPASD